jgi:hypothetical protein
MVPVLADTPADVGDAAETSVTTTLPNGDTLTLDLRAEQLSDGPRLVVDATRCADEQCTTRAYTGPLANNAFTVDRSAGSARLATVLDGRALAISWTPQPMGGYTVGSGMVAGDAHGIYAGNFAGTSADAAVGYDGNTCDGVGGVGTAVYADDGIGGPAPAESLAALHLPADLHLRC